jgi:diketogulonate reductase-like aldo/keto reductase
VTDPVVKPLDIPIIPLNNGVGIPTFGLGVYQARAGKPTRQAVGWALESGYRHFDTAAIYGNEADVGAALRASDIPRDQVFVTTKLWNHDHGYDATLGAMDASLARLGFEYVDLYLVHWPVPGLRRDTWRAMEQLLRDGRARAIGVSNYMVRHLDELLADCTIKPAVNQIELSPFNYRHRADVVAMCRQHDIAIEAYSPLTKGRRLKHPVVREIAGAHGRTVAQVLLRYVLEKETIALVKSVRRERIRENIDVFDFQLTPEEMARLDALDEALATGWDPTDEP